ncbi:MAG TPA: hypothetical protein VFG91_13935 [Woeseiaceae bacterium]|nr:hypothetical protein [Woeseiaceae bacterium]
MRTLGGEFFKRLRLVKWFDWLNQTYVVVAILGSVWAFVWGAETDKELLFGIALSTYFVVLLIVFVATVFMYGKKARFSEATKCLHEATHSARDAFRYMMWCLNPEEVGFTFEPRHFRAEIERCLTATASAFSLTTGVSCRASIKVLAWDQAGSGGLHVRTLARDTQSAGRARSEDRDGGRLHRIEENTDFWLIHRRKCSWFFSGNLPALQHYENSSIPLGWKPGDHWPLPYKSTIVLPIRYVYTNDDRDSLCSREADQGKLDEQDLYGFLAIDAGPRKAFDVRYDVEMGNAIADALVPIFHAYRQIREMTKPPVNTGVPQ